MTDTDATTLEPRPYQVRIVAKAVAAFAERGLRSVLIESPTGSGKTVMALLVARTLQERLGLSVGWVAMRRYLLAQAAAENNSRGIGLQATFLSMFDRDPPPGLDLLIVDEAQHDAADSMARLHSVVCPRFILGLSATPYRADRVKLCFDTVIKDAGIQELIADGHLSRYHHYTLPDFRPATVASTYLREPARWGRTVVYFHTLPQCHEAARLLAAGGVRCEVVTGTSDRESQLARFRAGECDVLLNCLVLAEGFDCPDLKTAFVRPSSRGPTVQMAGRVFRKHPSLAFKQVAQCRQTRWPFVRTAAAEQQYTWADGEWRTLTVNPRIAQVQLRTLQALARSEVRLPELLVKHAPAARPERYRPEGDL
jgi:superfamily II DNA or RNA helicase